MASWDPGGALANAGTGGDGVGANEASQVRGAAAESAADPCLARMLLREVPVFRSHRCMRAPRLGALHETHAVVATRFRLHVFRLRHLIAEDRLFTPCFARLGHVGRPIVTVLLEGRARLSLGPRDAWLEPGCVSVLGSKSAVEMRQDGSEQFLSVSLEWDPGWLGSRPGPLDVGRLSPKDVARVRTIASRIADSDGNPAYNAQDVAALVAVLRGAGVGLEQVPAGALAEPLPPHTLEIARALDGLLSNLTDQPMMVDLHDALGVSPRQANRLVAAFNERWGFNAATWQDTRTRRRVMLGASMMTARGATTEEVATAVGYGSPTAFCRALARADLPSPGAIAPTVRRLG